MSSYVYRLYRSTIAGQWSSTPIYQGAISEFVDSGLQPNTTYYYKLEAIDSLGNVSNPTTLVFTTSSNNIPSTPELTAETDGINGESQINLSWTESTVPGATVTAYILEKQSTTGSWSEIFNGATRTYQDENLVPNSSYNYRVRAYSSTYNTFSDYGTSSASTDEPFVDSNSTFIIPSNVSVWDAGVAQLTTTGLSEIPSNNDLIILSAGTSTTTATGGTRGPLEIRNLSGSVASYIPIKVPAGGITFRRSSSSSSGSILTIVNSRYFLLNGFDDTLENNQGIIVQHAISATQAAPDSPEAYIKIVGGVNGPSDNYRLQYIKIIGGDGAKVANNAHGILVNDTALTRSSQNGAFVENISFDYIGLYGVPFNGLQVGDVFENDVLPIKNCIISNIYAEYVGLGAIVLYGAWEGNNEIHHCVLRDCGTNPSTAFSDGSRSSITVWEGQCAVYNNTIINSGEHGIRVINDVGPLESVSPGAGYNSYVTFLTELYNNLIVRAGSTVTTLASRGIRYSVVTGVVKSIPKVYNNTCIANESFGIFVVANCIDGFVKNNIALDNAAGGVQIRVDSASVINENNLITGDSSLLFLDKTADDYHLRSAQPALGGIGVDISAEDIEGTLRSNPDIGAYEFILLEDIAPPTTPTNVTATVTAAREITLSWTASTDAGSGVASYAVQRSRSSASGPWGAPLEGITSTSLVQSQLNEGDTYYYQVRAIDNAGNIGNWSATAQATISVTTDTTPPTAPTNVTATATSSSAISVTWNESFDAGGIASYSVQRSTTSTTGPWTTAATGITATSLAQTGLTASTTYYYQVRAIDNAGNIGAWSATAQATTLGAAVDTTPPTVPTLSTTGSTSSSISLSWTASTDNVGVSKYVLEYSLNGTNWIGLAETNSTTRTYAHTGLNSSTRYYYRVKAVDAANNSSAYSTAVSLVTAAPPTAGTRQGLVVEIDYEDDPAWVSSKYGTKLSKHIGVEDITFVSSAVEGGVTILPRRGGKMMRSRLSRIQPNRPDLTYRSECQNQWPKRNNTTWFQDPNNTSQRDFNKGQEYWMGISVYIPANWDTNYVSSYSTGIFWQIHDRGFNDPGEKLGGGGDDWRANLFATANHIETGLQLRSHQWQPKLGYIATASISGTTMTVTSVVTGQHCGLPRPYQTVVGSGIAAGTSIVKIISANSTTGVGTYQVNISQTVSSRTVRGGVTWAQPGFFATNWDGTTAVPDAAGLTSSYSSHSLSPETLGLTWANVRGKWTDFVVNFKLSGASSPNDRDGFLRYWVNRRKVYDRTGQNNFGEQPEGHYMQFGLYNWGWRLQHTTYEYLQERAGKGELDINLFPKKEPDGSPYNTRNPPVNSWAGPDVRVIYHDELRVGNANSNFQSMDPEGRDPLP